MKQHRMLGISGTAAWMMVFIATLSTTLFADRIKVEGVIKARDGDTMILQTADNPHLVAELTNSTKVGQAQGMFKSRRKQMSMAALIPGLAVKVEGVYGLRGELVALSVSFTGDDLEQAQAIQAGMHEIKMQAQQNQQELERQNAELKAQNQALQQQQAQLSEQQQKVAANKAAIDAAIARFGQMDDYYILDELTVYFGNGKVKVDPQYVPQLVSLAQKAESINGYMIQVKGYASSVGSASLNQKLSEDRAANVTNILIQQGRVALTRMLAPGAMGESRQVGNDKTAEGEAENRRVVVRILQNKGIAGTADATSQPTTKAGS